MPLATAGYLREIANTTFGNISTHRNALRDAADEIERLERERNIVQDALGKVMSENARLQVEMNREVERLVAALDEVIVTEGDPRAVATKALGWVRHDELNAHGQSAIKED